jgi:hypothetical protein
VIDPIDQEAILYAFAIEPTHGQDTLNRYLAQYPGLADELIDLAFELRLAAVELPGDLASAADPGMQSAWAEFINCAPGKTEPARAGSFLSKFRGQGFADLANRMKVPRSILTAFRDRLVKPVSVPERFLCRFAEAAGSNLEEVREYLSYPPCIIGTAQFKADNKPALLAQVSFRQLVENTEMSDEQRKDLLQDCDDDGHQRG